MLVLSRKQKQQIRIGDEVVITVLQIKGGSVRIGIEAPREVHVMRGELEDFRDSQPLPARKNQDILAMAAHGTSGSHEADSTESGSAATDETEQESNSSNSRQRILELRFKGGDDDESSPTRLSEIAGSIPSLNHPR